MSEKCPQIHFFFKISAANADIVFKLKRVLYHHLKNPYTNLHNSDFYIDKINPLFRLKNVLKNQLFLNISAINTDIVLKLK